MKPNGNPTLTGLGAYTDTVPVEDPPTHNPLVSVIVPVYNGERYLAATLESVLAQDYRPLELLVVDDGSTDGSAAVARSFPGARLVQQRNAGAATARNTGIAESRGDLLAFLDSDDLWLPRKLSLQVGYLVSHPETGFVLTRQRIVLEPGLPKPAWLKPELLANDSVGYLPSTLLVRRNVFAKIGLFNPQFVPSEDAEWFFRARDAGVPMGVVEEVLLEKRVHSANLSHGTAVSQAQLLRAARSSIARKKRPDPQP